MRVFAAAATIGLLRDAEAIVIGAMVIAPLLGPNISLVFATTLGDSELWSRSMRANLPGAGIVLAIAKLPGLFVELEPRPGVAVALVPPLVATPAGRRRPPRPVGGRAAAGADRRDPRQPGRGGHVPPAGHRPADVEGGREGAARGAPRAAGLDAAARRAGAAGLALAA
ncbi:MAG: DUF389 domain-containing protein [Planctomycetota bacterium]